MILIKIDDVDDESVTWQRNWPAVPRRGEHLHLRTDGRGMQCYRVRDVHWMLDDLEPRIEIGVEIDG